MEMGKLAVKLREAVPVVSGGDKMIKNGGEKMS